MPPLTKVLKSGDTLPWLDPVDPRPEELLISLNPLNLSGPNTPKGKYSGSVSPLLTASGKETLTYLELFG